MGNRLVVLAALILCVVIPTGAIQADDTTPPDSASLNAPGGPDHKSRAEAKLQDFVTALDAYQNNHIQKRGRYWQALPSHSTPPGDTDTYPDRWFSRPSDAGPGWDSVGIIQFGPMPISVRVDEYVSPFGAGYVIQARYIDAGITWQRCIDRGPEQRCTSNDWFQVVETPLP